MLYLTLVTSDLADVVVENVAVSFMIESGVEAVISSHWAAAVPSATTDSSDIIVTGTSHKQEQREFQF